MPRPDRACARVGHRRHPPRAAPVRDHAATRVLRRVHGARGRVPPTGPAAVVDQRRTRPASRSAASPRRRACSSPTTSITTGAPAAASACTTPSQRLQPGVTEIHVQPAIDTAEVRAITDGRRRVDRRPRPRHPRPEAARAARRERRRADRLPRAQGRDASRLSAAADLAAAEQLEQLAGVAGGLQLAAHERHRGVGRRRRRPGR